MNPSGTTALVFRNVEEVIAYHAGEPVACGTFLAQIQAVADALPAATATINLCEDRYLFMVGFFAAITRGQYNLLLPSRQPGAVREALEADPDRCLLHDGKHGGDTPAAFDIRPVLEERPLDTSVPEIPDHQLSAVVHTSGSTGQPQEIRKYWETLVVGTRINLAHVLGDTQEHHGVVATVPPWHMFGLEYTILLPLLGNTSTYCGSTLFPAEIRAALEKMPDRRILVSTPVHLRAMINSGLTFPPVSRALCATSPLSPELARAVEKTLATDLLELYGCSEVGCLAFRRPVKEEHWTFFSKFQVHRQGSAVTVDADHVPEPVTLADTLEFDDDGRFILRGRDSDLVKIGGKRGSLAELTNRLLDIEGVDDGVIFHRQPDSDATEVRLSALVVSPQRTIDEIRSELTKVIDPVFLPRPIRQVDRLPRNRTGKLRIADLESLFRDTETANE